MDGSKPGKSDAAATRKRRSSILKSQRSVRAPLSELEFTVATPDQAKSRRVSFSRRTGVAEFEISEATTAWKNVYEEHNKSLESSANESGVKAAPRRVGHLGARASHFSDDEADVVDDEPAPPPAAQLDEPNTNTNTIQIFRLESNPDFREATDFDVDFSAMARPGTTDDLDLLRQDLELEQRDNIDEISIDVDFNATHFSLKGDDDMSITDTIRSPAVATEKSQDDFSTAATKKSQVEDWSADKENIVINPYIAPPPAEYPCEDDILVFDGKKCKFQSKLDLNEPSIAKPIDENVILDDMTVTQAIPVQILQSEYKPEKSALNTERRRTVLFGDDGDISVTQAVVNNIIAPIAGGVLDKENQRTMYFNDLADMSVTQAVPADIIQSEQLKTIVYDDDGHISMTEAVPAGALLTGPKYLEENKLDARRRTIVYEIENVSMTGVVPGNICEDNGQGSSTGRRKTIVYDTEDGNVSMTGVLPANIIEVKSDRPNDRRKTVVYDNDNGNVSMTRVLPSNIIDEGTKQADRTRNVVFGNDDGNLSMTGVAPVNILEEKVAESNPRRRTIVYDNDNGTVSMTGVVTANIIDAKVNEQNMNRRRTVVFGNEHGNLSITGVAPVNILDGAKVQEANTDRRKTIVYDNDNGNVSMTGVVTTKILDEAKLSQLNMDRRKTVVFGNDEGNLSMTGVAPVNIIAEEVKAIPNKDKRKTIVYGTDEGNISVTGVVPANIIDQAKMTPNTEKRKTIVYGTNDGNVSMTGVIPSNILDQETKISQPQNTERRKTIVSDNNNENLSMTGVAPVTILDGDKPNIEYGKSIDGNGNLSPTAVTSQFEDANEEIAKETEQPNTERRKTVVFDGNDGNMSITGVIPEHILEKENMSQAQNENSRKTIVYGNEDGNVSMTGVVSDNIYEVNDIKQCMDRTSIVNNKENMSITGFLLSNIDIEHDDNITANEDRKSVYENGNILTCEISHNIIEEAKAHSANEDKKTVIYEDNDVSMTEVLPELTGDTNVVPETQTSISETRKNLEVNDEVEKIDAVTRPILIDSDEEVSMTLETNDGRHLDAANPCSTTFNKSLAGQCSTTLDKSLAPGCVFNKTLADQTFDKSKVYPDKSVVDQLCTTLDKSLAGRSTTINKSLADHKSIMLEKSLVDHRSATFNKSLANQECSAINKLNGQSTSMNKAANQVLVYGATTERDDKNSMDSYIVENLKPEDNQYQASPESASTDLSLKNSSMNLEEKSLQETKESEPLQVVHKVLDALLDMSQASVEELPKESESDTTRPVRLVTQSGSAESFILVKDDDEPKDTEFPALDVSEPLALEYKKEKHGIVCKLQRKLSELKDILHIKEKSPKNQKALSYDNQDQKHNSKMETSTSDHFENNSPRRSISPDNVQKNKSVTIDLTPRMCIEHEEAPEQPNQTLTLSPEENKEDNKTQANDTNTQANDTNTQANDTNTQANDTKAILDALSDFTDTRRSGDFEHPCPERTLRTSAPERKSMVISREDLLREISMAQALMKTEMQQTDMELEATEGSSDDQEPSPPRLSGEVVKTLRFEDEESILEPKVLHKPSPGKPSPRRNSTVIPTYEISDPVKELMNDLIKPLADVDLPVFKQDPTRSSQVDNLDSSQIDLIPARPKVLTPRSCLRRTEHEVAHSKMHVEPRKEPQPLIYFDHLNPLNNVVLPPLDQAVVHKYNPRVSAESLSPSMDSRCCQTESQEPIRDMEVGMVLFKSTVDRGVAIERNFKDSEVNTSIVMKGNRELLAASSSLTLVDDALPQSRSDDLHIDMPSRSPVRVIFRLASSPLSSVHLDSDITSEGDERRKRGHVPSKNQVTPKPAIKMHKGSANSKADRRMRSVSPSGKDSASSRGSSVTVPQLYACARSETSTSATDSRCSKDWRPELLHEPSSKNLISEQESGVNVVAKIDVLPFMGTECEWESRAADTWSFLLLRGRLRLLVRLEHRATNTTRALVRADTPVRLVLVQHAAIDQDHKDPVAALCLCLAAEALQRVADRGVARAGQLPLLLRRCAAVSRVALHWARCMRYARISLAFSLADDGELSLKVANIPLRSVWEVTFRIELVDPGAGGAVGAGGAGGGGTPYPRAARVRVTRVVADWVPSPQQVTRVLDTVPEDWGHVPRTVWKIFKYLKDKTTEDDLFTV